MKNLSAAAGPLSSQTLAGLLRRSGDMQHGGKRARLLWNVLLEVYTKKKEYSFSAVTFGTFLLYYLQIIAFLLYFTYHADAGTQSG